MENFIYMIQNKKRKFQCEICDKTFVDRSNYRKHTKLKKNSCLSKEQVDALLEKVNNVDKLFEEKVNRINVLELENKCLKLELEKVRKEETKKYQDNVSKIKFFVMFLKKNGLEQKFIDTFKDGICYNSVVKFIKQCKNDRYVPGELKKTIKFEQHDTCLDCGMRTICLEIDHKIPLYQGGTNEKTNLQGLCPECHGKKTMKDSIEFYNYIQLVYEYYNKNDEN